MNAINKTSQTYIKRLLFALIGVLIIGATSLYMTENISYLSLAMAFSAFIMIIGVVEIYFSIAYKRIIGGSGWFIAVGVGKIITGLILVVNL